MGKNKTRTNVQNFVNTVSMTLFSTMVKVKNSCKQSGTVTQDMNLSVGNDDIVAACIDSSKAYLSYLSKDVSGETMVKLMDRQANMLEDCQDLMTSNTIIRELENNAELDITQDCKFEQNDVDKINASMANDLTAKASKEGDSFGEALGQAVSSFTGGSWKKTDIVNQQDVQNFLSKAFTVDSVNEVLAEYSLIQSLNTKVSSAKNTYISAVKQTAMVQAVQTVLIKNQTVADAINSISNKVSTDASSVDRGLADMVKNVTDNIRELGSNLSKDAFGAIGAVATAWIVGVIVVILVIVIVLFLVFRKGGGSEAQLPFPRYSNYGAPPASAPPASAPPASAPPAFAPSASAPPASALSYAPSAPLYAPPASAPPYTSPYAPYAPSSFGRRMPNEETIRTTMETLGKVSDAAMNVASKYRRMR